MMIAAKHCPYKSIAPEALLVFAQQVYDRMSSNPAYQKMTAELSQLNQILQTCGIPLDNDETMAAAQSRLLTEQLHAVLDGLAVQLHLRNNGDPQWYAQAGMAPAPTERKGRRQPAPPFDLTACATTFAGQVKVSFRVSDPSCVVTHKLEYSYDGVHWQNGAYGAARGIRIGGLLSGHLVYIRVRSIGRGHCFSEWSESLQVWVG